MDKALTKEEFIRMYHHFIRFEDPQASGSITVVYNDEQMLSDLNALLRNELIKYDKWQGIKYCDNYDPIYAYTTVDDYLKEQQQ
jgi:hypothetical protein